MPRHLETSKIAVIGAGDVGGAVAFSLILNAIAREVLMVDVDETKRDGQVQDLSDATYRGNTSTRIRTASSKEAGQADIVVITAGAKQKEGESRLDLIDRNLGILRSVIESMKPFKESTILLHVANPVDILTYFAQKFSGLPHGQVIGSGTFLDSVRLRGLLSEDAGVAASSIDAFVLGEHGESQFIAWSSVAIAGVPIARALPKQFEKLDREGVASDVKEKAGRIIESKGATSFGIGSVASSICENILFDKRTVRPVSRFVQEFGCYLSLPAVLGRKGVVGGVDADLSEEERKKLKQSAESLRKIIRDSEEKQDKKDKSIKGSK